MRFILLPLFVFCSWTGQTVFGQFPPSQLLAISVVAPEREDTPRTKKNLPAEKDKESPELSSPESLGSIEIATRPSHRNIPHIPEPMYFDLVRGLGASRGEVEINSLFSTSPGSGTFSWAPEIEVAFRDGFSFELEFPMENRNREALKVALQGTFNTFHSHQGIQGFQVIAERSSNRQGTKFDALHLLGHRFNHRWSAFFMQGVRTGLGAKRGQVSGLFNPSVFFEAGPRLVLGVESNLVFGRSTQRRFLFLPQTQISLNHGFAFEFGTGFERETARRARFVTAIRLIKCFNFGK